MTYSKYVNCEVKFTRKGNIMISINDMVKQMADDVILIESCVPYGKGHNMLRK